MASLAPQGVEKSLEETLFAPWPLQGFISRTRWHFNFEGNTPLNEIQSCPQPVAVPSNYRTDQRGVGAIERVPPIEEGELDDAGGARRDTPGAGIFRPGRGDLKSVGKSSGWWLHSRPVSGIHSLITMS